MPTAFRPSSKSDFHSARANELRQLGEILLRHQLIRDAGPLLSAATNCQGNNHASYYEYEIPHLLFQDLPEGMMHHARPQSVESKEFTIDVKVDLCGIVPNESVIEDPFTYLVVDIFITGQTLTDDGDVRDSKCAWHLDRHEEESTSNQQPRKTRKTSSHTPRKGRSPAVHSIYHFQHGGQRVWDLADYGEQLLLEPPRLAHPPLDGVLAIDFVLSNYLGDGWKLLREQEPRYDEMVKDAQRRCWRSYALASAALWQNETYSHSWRADAIWPQLAASFYPTGSTS